MGNILNHETIQPNKLKGGGNKIRRVSTTPSMNIRPHSGTTINAAKIETVYVISVNDALNQQSGKIELSEILKEFARQKLSQHAGLSMADKELIARCWRTHIITRHRDIFHKTMLACVEGSPKMNEMIACGRFCYRDLTKWPKSNRLCQAQFKFFERLIYELNMDQGKIRTTSFTLGMTHAKYSDYGMKPHFLDMFEHQFLEQLNKIKMTNLNEKRDTILAFLQLLAIITDAMNDAYSQKVWEKRRSICKSQEFLDVE